MKRTIRLTETDLHRVIKESVTRILEWSAMDDLEDQEMKKAYRKQKKERKRRESEETNRSFREENLSEKAQELINRANDLINYFTSDMGIYSLSQNGGFYRLGQQRGISLDKEYETFVRNYETSDMVLLDIQVILMRDNGKGQRITPMESQKLSEVYTSLKEQLDRLRPMYERCTEDN